MAEKTVTVTITAEEAMMLYRACRARAYHFQTMQPEDDEMYKIDRTVACSYRTLAQSIIDQIKVNP